MIAAKQAAWLFITMIALACSGWYFAGSATTFKLDEHTLSTTTDMVVNNLTVHQFDKDGKFFRQFFIFDILSYLANFGEFYWTLKASLR